jgi:hypothetical protein
VFERNASQERIRGETLKRASRWAWLVFLAAITTMVFPPAWGAAPAAPDATTQTVNVGYLENFAFKKQPGKERVILTDL